MFVAVVRGRYSAGPEILDGEVEVAYESVRPEKQAAELAVLHDLFLRWYETEATRLTRPGV